MSEPPITFFSQNLVPEPSESLKKVYRSFVEQYLRDYDAVAACSRMGYAERFAEVNAATFMKAPYVAKLIKDMEEDTAEDDDAEAEKQSRIIKAGLMREANYFGPGSSHSGRVAALAQLSKIHGMEQSKIDHQHKGGVMLVPSTATDVEAWQAAAIDNQNELHTDNGSRK